MIYYEICNNILAVQRREHARKELIPLSKRKRGLLLLALLLTLALGLWHLAIHPQPALTPVASERAPQGRVLLVPLDSRPPCRAHVAALGRIAGRDNLLTLVAIGSGLTVTSEATTAAHVPGICYRPIIDEVVPFNGVWSPKNDNPALRRFVSMAKMMARRQGVDL